MNKLRLQQVLRHRHGLWARYGGCATSEAVAYTRGGGYLGALLLCVGEDVGLEIRRLGKLFTASLKTNIYYSDLVW